METIINLFQALGNDVRYKIVQMLLEQKKKNRSGMGLCVCDILKHCGVANSTMTHHLDWLTSVELLVPTRKGRWIYYDVNIEKVRELKAIIKGL